MTYASFAELYEVLSELRVSEDRAQALALTEQHLHAFPRYTALIHLARAELLAESGRPTEALDTLHEALRAGCRYPREALERNGRLAAIRDLPGFVNIAERSRRQWEDAFASSAPQRTLLQPTAGSRHPLLVVLHGNNSDIAETLPQWSSAVKEGWIVAVLQSSEPGTTPGSFTWNDRERTGSEVVAHLEAIRSETGWDRRRIALGGFSMGALQAIALALTGRLRVSGVISVAAWLPHIREFTALAAAGNATFVPSYVVVGRKDPSYNGAKQVVDLSAEHGCPAFLDERGGLGHEYPEDMPATLTRALQFVAGPSGFRTDL